MAFSRADEQSISPEEEYLQAARSGDLAKVSAYIEANKDNLDAINHANEHSGNTALILAAGFGHVAVVQALLAAHVDVGMKNIAGINALGFAQQRRQLDVANLLKNVVQPCAANASAMTADEYLRAASDGDVAKIRQYIQDNQSNPAAMNIKDPQTHDTALMRAVRGGHEEIIDALLRTNLVDVRAINQRGETAALIAQNNGHGDMAEWLTQLAAFSDPNPTVSTHASVSASMIEDESEDLHDHALSDYLCPVSRMVFFRPVLFNPCGHAVEGDYAYGEHGADKLDECPCCRAAIDETNPAHPAVDMERHIKSEVIKNPKLYSQRYFNVNHLRRVLENNGLDTRIGKRFVRMLEHAANHLAESFGVLVSYESGLHLLQHNRKIKNLITPKIVLKYLNGQAAKEQEVLLNKLADIPAFAALLLTPELRERNLALAAQSGNIEKVKELVARGADINPVLGVLIEQHKSVLLWWLHENKVVRDTITHVGMQAMMDPLLHSRKGCQLLMEDDRLLGLCPLQVEGKSRGAWLALKKAEPNFSQAGFFAAPLSEEEKRKKQEAKKLLECVLFPITANVAKVIELAKSRPELYFVKATAYDQAMDLKGIRRKIKGGHRIKQCLVRVIMICWQRSSRILKRILQLSQMDISLHASK